MTVIAWDGKTLAADKRSMVGGSLIRTVTKIRRIGDLLCGVTGDFDLGLALFKWVENGREIEKYPTHQRENDEFCVLMVIDDGRIFIYERTPFFFIIEDEKHAIGSGRDFAVAAMHLGKSAAVAVAIASLFCAGCGNGIDELSP